MKTHTVPIQERGLVLLIGLAVLTSGFLLFQGSSPTVQPAQSPTLISLQQVRVLLPSFVERSPVDINSATIDELITLPGIGPALAQRIIDDRLAHGPFQSVNDLQRVNGIGPKTVADFADQAVAGSPAD